MVAVVVPVSDCNLKNEKECVRKREIYVCNYSRSLELGQTYLRAKRKPALNGSCHPLLCSYSLLLLHAWYYHCFLDIFICLCLTRSWLSCQSLCNWLAFTVSGPFPTTSLSSSSFLLPLSSPQLLSTTQSFSRTYITQQSIRVSNMAPVSSSWPPLPFPWN